MYWIQPAFWRDMSNDYTCYPWTSYVWRNEKITIFQPLFRTNKKHFNRKKRQNLKRTCCENKRNIMKMKLWNFLVLHWTNRSEFFQCDSSENLLKYFKIEFERNKRNAIKPNRKLLDGQLISEDHYEWLKEKKVIIRTFTPLVYLRHCWIIILCSSIVKCHTCQSMANNNPTYLSKYLWFNSCSIVQWHLRNIPTICWNPYSYKRIKFIGVLLENFCFVP